MKMSTLPLLFVAMVALTRAAVNISVWRGNSSSCPCPSGWAKYDQRCFLYVPRAMPWVKALRNCQSMGGSLASVHSSSEYHFIQLLITRQTHSYPEAWLGGTDLGYEGHWRWADGSHFLFSYWCWGEPNNMFFQHCLQMNYSGRKCWDDVWCNRHRSSVCAKDI